MRGWIALYRKELADNKGLYLFLLGLCAVVEVSAIMGAREGIDQQVSHGGSVLAAPTFAMLALLPFTSALILPLILVGSLNSELKAQTHYLLFSLPVARSAILLAKLLAVATVGAAIFLVSAAAVYLIYAQMYDLWLNPFAQMMGAAPAPASVWSILGAGYFSTLFLLLGLVSVAAGVRYAVRRMRGLATFGAFVGGIYLYVKLRQPVMSAFLDTGS